LRWCDAAELDGVVLHPCRGGVAYARHSFAKSNMSRRNAYSYTDGITHSNTYSDGITQSNTYTRLYVD
jgi:hypothetical protein